MADDNKLTQSDLFTELSESEQETVSGGFDFVIQRHDINSFASNEFNVDENQRSISSKQTSAYNSSLISFGFNMNSVFGDSMRRMREYGFSPLSFIRRIIFYLFY
ncbi:MAG: hypothetical protein HXY43_01270 [Fischerella sp.]|uniref:hypothetical protein n=1 Tax=Fischerella sp. TaxID=1191 RepID=UPI0017ACF234|nr:hypothetical protein [Fischerella sp.]NWF57970.1 hypothetical protein [Fischerella sp.]